MTDANGNTATGTITVNIVDDVPTATLDSGNVNEGALLTVAASGVLSNDVAGADGFTAGGGVVGVRAAGGDLTTDVTTGVNTSIAGLHGTLILQANGSYTYQSTANNITANTTDVFVYTVRDGDGDLSTTTLTINLANATVVAPADNDVTVNEARWIRRSPAPTWRPGRLPAASAPAVRWRRMRPTSSTVGRHGAADLCAGDRRQRGDGGHLRHHPGQHRRQLYLHADQRRSTPPRTPTTAPTRGGGELHLPVTDANGNTATGTITVNIVDDVPTATLDSGNVNEGALLTVAASGVLSNDVAGADGFTAGGGVVGVRAAGGDLTTDVTTGVNTNIAGLHGTLVLQANGSYTYQSTANNITANTTDVFVYTVRDGDGDLSTTTLTINLPDARLLRRPTTT